VHSFCEKNPLKPRHENWSKKNTHTNTLFVFIGQPESFEITWGQEPAKKKIRNRERKTDNVQGERRDCYSFFLLLSL